MNHQAPSVARGFFSRLLDLLELLEMEVDGPSSAAGEVAPQLALLQASPAAAINDNDLNLLELLSRETEIDGSRSPPGERHLAAHLVAGVSRGGGHQRQLF